MTLRSKARRGCDVRERLIRVADQRPRARDSTLFNKCAGCDACRGPERTSKVMDAESGASGEVRNVDRTIKVRLDKYLHTTQGGRRQPAALMALPCCGRLVEPSPKVREVALLHVACGSKDVRHQRKFFWRERREHLGAAVPQWLPDAVDPLARVWSQFNLWSARAARAPRIASHLEPGDRIA